MTEAFVCDAVRTPIGRWGGGLAPVRADDLAAVPVRALLERNDVDPEAIEEIYLGCANQAGEDNRNLARMAGLLAGLPVSVPGVTVNRLCASGADAVAAAARAIRAGEMDLALAGGAESMTRAPFVMAKAETAFQRSARIEDTSIGWRFVNPRMEALHGVASMPETAETVAQRWGVSREDQDRFAFESQRKAAAAQASGYFGREIVAVEVERPREATGRMDRDEHPRETTLDRLAALKPAVRPDGTVTAGNASGVNDGAAAMFIASEAGAKQQGLEPRARLLGFASAGVEPDVMGIGPVQASRRLLERLGLSLDDMDLIELNEAFASQVVACLRELGVRPDDERVNPRGGAIALGHPLGMSGARLVQTAVHGLEQGGGRRALVSLCVGVGQGVALVVERV
ncbi:3-oxoadipyl-CoA thiolase [Brevundimonas sp. S30B]|uniref:3-oxoadipyl-CoA thiolase n=1 Tax=unclassified Brevundimonas TaxID=2622653 RepID=UPI001071B0FC|nr:MULTISPECIES: 3-oxoadipyl-CoA thiolase [unclassified Brevundimonas]QBX36660.1 3-oxoadipyl-CoA thiolase [Brevundimonas sp. MF30-B]TFW04545.1 3-oxoadipyl-CoA thiolase [Brevundimonas sp. S30B]